MCLCNQIHLLFLIDMDFLILTDVSTFASDCVLHLSNLTNAYILNDTFLIFENAMTEILAHFIFVILQFFVISAHKILSPRNFSYILLYFDIQH